MKHWIMPIIADFESLDTQEGKNVFIVWRTHTHFSVGDIAYFYIKHPEMRVGYKLQVSRTNLPAKDYLSGKKEYINHEYYLKDDGKPTTFVEFLLLEKFSDSPEYSFKALLGHGFKGFVRKNQGMQESVVQYLENLSSMNDITLEADPEFLTNPKSYPEGSAVKVFVNRYERNRVAREKCIALKGCTCSVCGMDFAKTYGKVGKGFIHVHHTTPISSIGEGYKVDYEKDLVPVCPNCHAMLHRKDPPYTIDELRDIIS
jgi:5-methylcytosine-specific restriction protein A